MEEWKADQEFRGRVFKNGFKDVQRDPECDAAWKSLDDDAKASYNTRAKSRRVVDQAEKLTGLGEKLTDVEKNIEMQKEFDMDMRAFIEETVASAVISKTLQNLRFYVIHVNHFYERPLDDNSFDYHPAEVAVVEFSLQDSITNAYTTIINEPIKLGYKNPAQQYSNTRHNIPLNPEFGEKDYAVIYDKITEILKPGIKNGQYPPIYTLFDEEYINPVKSFLERICLAGGKPDDYFTLYSFEHLFAACYTALQKKASFSAVVEEFGTLKDNFSFYPDLECDFHNDLAIGIAHCSQSHAKRWIYLLNFCCCSLLGIELIPKKHVPIMTQDSISALDQQMGNCNINGRKMVPAIHSQQTSTVMAPIDKDRRRAEAASGAQIHIIDHSKINCAAEIVAEKSPANQRPSDDSIDFSEQSFPSIGGGAKKKQNPSDCRGRGYASALRR